MKRVEHPHRIVLNPQYLVVILTILTTIIRLVFFGTMYNGRSDDALIGGALFNAVLLQVGQCIMVR